MLLYASVAVATHMGCGLRDCLWLHCTSTSAAEDFHGLCYSNYYHYLHASGEPEGAIHGSWGIISHIMIWVLRKQVIHPRV